MRQRLHVVVAQRIDHVGHRGDAGTDAGAGLEVAQRFEQDILALGGKPSRGAEARIIVGVARPAALLLGELFAFVCERVVGARGFRLGRLERGVIGAEIADVFVSAALARSAASPRSCARRSGNRRVAIAWPRRVARRAKVSAAVCETPSAPWQPAQPSANALPAATSAANARPGARAKTSAKIKKTKRVNVMSRKTLRTLWRPSPARGGDSADDDGSKPEASGLDPH